MRYLVYNQFEIYGGPEYIKVREQGVEAAREMIATSIAWCCWPPAVDGMVDMSEVLQQREQREEPYTGIADEIEHYNDVLDAAEENGGTLPLEDLITLIAADAVVAEEFTGEN